ncbi:MAG: Ig-like domain-containing protein [Deltaproteobacteria bacterium]|nr:Ig-like domain-containing protein [Deltaproteobacteria bacterium]
MLVCWILSLASAAELAVAPLEMRTLEETATTATLVVTAPPAAELVFGISADAAKGQAKVDDKGRVSYTPAKDAVGTDRFNVGVSDGTTDVDVVVDVVITNVNDAPVVAGVTLAANEDEPSAVTLAAADVDGDALSWFLAKGPGHGSAKLDEKSGRLELVPAANWHGSDSLNVTVKDGATTSTATILITVASVNDAPVVEAMTLSLREGGKAGLPLTVRDVDGDALTFSIGTPPAKGVATVDAKGRVSYTGGKSNNGDDRFVVVVSDGKAQVERPVDVVIAAVNEAPVVEPATLAAREDETATITVSAKDPDGDALVWSIARPPVHGSATIDPSSGLLSFVPSKDWHGSDVVTVTARDQTLSASANVAITCAAANDPPVVEGLKLAMREDEAGGAPLVARDVDGDALAFSIGTAPAKGTASVDAKGRVSFKGAKDQNGAERFVVVASDGKANVEVAVDVVIAAVNDPPLAAVAALAGTEDTDGFTTLWASDADGDALTWSITRQPAHGVATLDQAGRLSFAPHKNWHGSDAVQVALQDASTSTSATVLVTVAAQNDAPTAEPLALTAREDDGAAGSIVARDVDGDALTWSIGTPPEHGAARVDAKGRVTYQPAKDHNGTDRFVVVASDATLKAEAAVSVVVAAANDAPVATASVVSVTEDSALNATLAGTDVDGDPLSFTLVKGPPGATLDKKGALTWSPPLNFHGTEKVSFDVDDGKLSGRGEATITVTPVNDAPRLAARALATAEDKPVKGQAQGSDVDGDKLKYRIAKQGEKGDAVVDAASGSISYAPRADVWGEDAIVIAVDDGTTSTEQTLKVSISSVPDAPRTASASERATWQLREDEPAESTLPGSDVDGDALTFKLTSEAKLGSVRMVDAKKGLIAFAPKLDQSGNDEVRFEVSDGTSKVAGTLSITVTPVNDAPVASPLALSTKEDQAVSAVVGMSDVDGDALKLVVIEQPKNGSVRIDNAAKGSLIVEPARDFTGTLVFKVAASETLTGAPVEVKVTVTPENDAPVAQAQSRATPEDTPVIQNLVAVDVDSSALQYRVQKAPTLGTVVVDAATGRYTYTPRKNAFGDDGFVFVVSDGALSSSARVSLKVNPVDDAPVAAPGVLSSPRAGRVTGKLLGRDPEGASLLYRIVSQPSLGRAVIVDEKTGTYAFTPYGGNNKGNTTFAFVVEAGGQTSEPGLITVSVD